MNADNDNPKGQDDKRTGAERDRPEDGPPQTRRSPDGASPDRQIAQEPQQSTGQGMGQS